THHALANSTQRVRYFNSGCWTELPCTYLTVRDGSVRIHTFGGPGTVVVGGHTVREMQLNSKPDGGDNLPLSSVLSQEASVRSPGRTSDDALVMTALR